MGTHYRELFNKALNIKKTKLEYIKPNSVNKFESQIKKIFTPLKIKKQSTVLFHIDEKWSDINVSKNFIINLLEEITANRKINLIVTNGKYNTGLNSEIWNFYKLKKLIIKIIFIKAKKIKKYIL